MSWNTIPVELLERALVLTASPSAIAKACRTCKNWNGISADAYFWKHVYYAISNGRNIILESDVNWKQKVADQTLTRHNIKKGRCIVRTLATTETVEKRVTLDFSNYTVYKDYCLINWLLTEDFGSYGAVSKKDSHLINLATEDVINLDLQEILFVNHYLAQSPSHYYGGANFHNLKLEHFDPSKLKSSQDVFNSTINIFLEFPMYRTHITNYCYDSNYIGLVLSEGGNNYKVQIYNGETGEVVYSIEDARTSNVQMYDNFVVLLHKNSLRVVNILTKKVAKRKFEDTIVPGFVTSNTVAVRTKDKIFLWSFIDKTETVFPAWHVPMEEIKMIYNDMWVVFREAKLAFYDMTDGTLVNTLALRQCSSEKISLLSDGRLVVAQRHGIRVISFIDSEVNRKITIRLLNTTGTVTDHEMSAYELPKFYFAQLKSSLALMTSRIISYSDTTQPNERFVMIFAEDENYSRQMLNEAATQLITTARTPTSVNTPFQGWTFATQAITVKNNVVDRVYGKAIIAREKIIDGRWQLVSMQ